MLILFSPVFLCFVTCDFVYAQTWVPLGFADERIEKIVRDPGNPVVIYVGSTSDFTSGKKGSLYKTTNLGETWDTLLTDISITDIDIEPGNQNILYITLSINSLTQPGILKTTDGGTTWFSADEGISITDEEGPLSLCIDPVTTQIVYAGTGGFGGGNLYKSTNGGTTWYPIGDPHPLIQEGVNAIEVNPLSSNIVFIATAFSGNILRSINYGVTWATTSFPQIGRVYDIHISEYDTSTIYVGTSKFGLYTSTSGGSSWTNTHEGMPDSSYSVYEIASSIVNGNLILGALVVSHPQRGVYTRRIENNTWKFTGIDTLSVKTMLLHTNGSVYVGGSSGLFWKNNLLHIFRNKNRELIPHITINPNPFNASTRINVNFPQSTYLKCIYITDILGKNILTMDISDQNVSELFFQWSETQNLSSGIYLIHFVTNKNIFSDKMFLIK